VNDITGTVYLVGAGTGDPDLITVKGLNVLRKADVVVYDALANIELLKNCKDARLIDAGKRGNLHKMSQDDINTLLVSLSSEYGTIVRLKGGDPFMFGRGAEEAAALRAAGVEVHVIPGISSPIAVPELAGIPVTHRDHASQVTFITGHQRDEGECCKWDWGSIARYDGTLVILMGLSNSECISSSLIAGGRDENTPVAIVTDGSLPTQRTTITDLGRLHGTICDNGLKAPGIIVIGDCVKERSILGDLA